MLLICVIIMRVINVINLTSYCISKISSISFSISSICIGMFEVTTIFILRVIIRIVSDT